MGGVLAGGNRIKANLFELSLAILCFYHQWTQTYQEKLETKIKNTVYLGHPNLNNNLQEENNEWVHLTGGSIRVEIFKFCQSSSIHTDAVARLNSFMVLKLCRFESFRV